MNVKVGVVDYGMGNLHSVSKALALQGARVTISDKAVVLKKSDLLVLPGVGSFGAAARTLAKKKLVRFLREWIQSGRPFLGICLGYQLLFEGSQENPGVKGLGVIPGRVVRFGARQKKKFTRNVPHMGWNTVRRPKGKRSPLFQGIKDKDSFYFVHTYYPVPKQKSDIFTQTSYGDTFCSAIQRGRIFASQFHPEKSGNVGLRLLKNILKETKKGL